jgi:hypothetical protein
MMSPKERKEGEGERERKKKDIHEGEITIERIIVGIGKLIWQVWGEAKNFLSASAFNLY